MSYDHFETVLLCEVWTLFGEHWMILQILYLVVLLLVVFVLKILQIRSLFSSVLYSEKTNKRDNNE